MPACCLVSLIRRSRAEELVEDSCGCSPFRCCHWIIDSQDPGDPLIQGGSGGERLECYSHYHWKNGMRQHCCHNIVRMDAIWCHEMIFKQTRVLLATSFRYPLSRKCSFVQAWPMLSQPQEPIGAEKKLKERNNLDIFGWFQMNIWIYLSHIWMISDDFRCMCQNGNVSWENTFRFEHSDQLIGDSITKGGSLPWAKAAYH